MIEIVFIAAMTITALILAGFGRRDHTTIPSPDSPPCRCSCPADAHLHYRPGYDCGACGPDICPAYRAWRQTTRPNGERP